MGAIYLTFYQGRFEESAKAHNKKITKVALFVFVGFKLNNAWAGGTPFLQPEIPLSSRSLVSGELTLANVFNAL